MSARGRFRHGDENRVYQGGSSSSTASVPFKSWKQPKDPNMLSGLGRDSGASPNDDREVKWTDTAVVANYTGNNNSYFNISNQKDTCNLGVYFNSTVTGFGESERNSEMIYMTALHFRISFMKPASIIKSPPLPSLGSSDVPIYVDNKFIYQTNEVVRVVFFVDVDAQAKSSANMAPWFNDQLGAIKTPGLFATDDIDSFYDDRYQTIYRVIYDNTFPINEIASGIVVSNSNYNWDGTGVGPSVIKMMNGVNTWTDGAVNLYGMEANYPLGDSENKPIKNGIQCLIRRSGVVGNTNTIGAKVFTRLLFVDAS